MGSYSKYKVFMCFTRKFPCPVAGPPEDVIEAFKGFGGGDALSPEGLRRFLEEKQGEVAATALADAVRIADEVRRLRHRQSYFSKLARPLPLSLDDFHYFLFSDDLNPPLRSQVHQDMTAPLSHYFIYTGHNSYLTGNQLSSDCSDVPIIKALQRGVRVIELDLWPNSTKDKVHVLHGRTMTSPVDLNKCLKSIKEYAFCASPYPVVITLEDHLTPDLQAEVAKMVSEIFGDMLYYPKSGPFKECPSPEDLKMKIIISTKPPKEYLESKNFKDKENGSQKVKDSPEEEAQAKVTYAKDESGNGSEKVKDSPEEEAQAKVTSVKDESENGSQKVKDSPEEEAQAKVTYAKDESESDEQNESEETDNDEDERESDEDDNKFQQISAPQYRLLITIYSGKPKGPLKDALKVDPDKVRRLSLSEKQFAKATASHGADLVRFTQKNILRIYPRGTRFDSSNYNPMLAWTHGAQMVAFNMQGYGKSLWLMQGLFRANGGCGYVKKPDFLLNSGPDGDVFDPKIRLPVKKTLKVKVYMGDGWRTDFKETHFDTYSPPDFYTRVGIAGVSADTRMKETKPIEDAWTPVWDEEFSFPLTVPELALLRIEVLDYDLSDTDDFGGQTCLPVSELRPGIRAVPLYDHKGMKFKSVRLLMRFQFV